MICKQAVLFPRLLRLFLQVAALETDRRRPTNTTDWEALVSQHHSQPIVDSHSLPCSQASGPAHSSCVAVSSIRSVTACFCQLFVKSVLVSIQLNQGKKQRGRNSRSQRRSFPILSGRTVSVGSIVWGVDHQRASLARELTTRSWIISSGPLCAHSALGASPRPRHSRGRAAARLALQLRHLMAQVLNKTWRPIHLLKHKVHDQQAAPLPSAK